MTWIMDYRYFQSVIYTNSNESIWIFLSIESKGATVDTLLLKDPLWKPIETNISVTNYLFIFKVFRKQFAMQLEHCHQWMKSSKNSNLMWILIVHHLI